MLGIERIAVLSGLAGEESGQRASLHALGNRDAGDVLPALAVIAGFLHAKTVTIDDAVTSIGTANWDLRSFKWNFETNAVIYDVAFGKRYRSIFEEDMARCTEITKDSYAHRPRSTQIKESVCRLFSGAL